VSNHRPDNILATFDVELHVFSGDVPDSGLVNLTRAGFDNTCGRGRICDVFIKLLKFNGILIICMQYS